MRFFCSVPYRQFTRLAHGILRDRRIPLPAWAYNAIRTAFKVETEDFEGYDDEDEWNGINAQPLINRSTQTMFYHHL